jgi:phosphatidylinositol alpha-1,6-mannosyltransferase
MEAAAAGLPIVTTKVSGSTDGVIHGESGFVVTQGDMEGFTGRVVELLQDPEKAAAMGQRGPKLMQELASKREQFNQLQIDAWENAGGFSG